MGGTVFGGVPRTMTFQFGLNGWGFPGRARQVPTTITTRPADNDSDVFAFSSGLAIVPSEDFVEIGAVISTNTQNATRARLYDYSTGTYEQTVDISASVAGDTFAFEYEFVSGNEYGFELDAAGADYTRGFASSFDYPYTGDEIDIIAASIDGTQGTTDALLCVNDIGASGL